jgi:RNA recognition motif-containing protein
MPKMLHVHRLPTCTTDADLQKLFEGVGRVINCDVIADGSTRSSKVIGFVEMETETEEEARRAIDQFNGKELAGRVIYVSERP